MRAAVLRYRVAWTVTGAIDVCDCSLIELALRRREVTVRDTVSGWTMNSSAVMDVALRIKLRSEMCNRCLTRRWPLEGLNAAVCSCALMCTAVSDDE